MFLDAWRSAFVEDGACIGGSFLLILFLSVIVFYVSKNFFKYNYYSDFQKNFWAIAVFNIIAVAAAFSVAQFVLQNQTVAYGRIKNKEVVLSALNQDYNDRIKNAKTKQQKDAVKKEYEENGFEIKDKFVVAKDASKVKQSLLDWLNIRDRMEKKCNGKIKIGDIKNNESALKSLPKKFNDKAVKALVLIRKIRYYVWFGVIGVFVVVVPALIAFCISSRGTKAEIEKALGKEPKAKEEKNADAEKTEA